MMENLSERVIRSGLWMVALNVTGRLLGMVRLLILARLLTPYDFGLVGIALVVISLFESFSAMGTGLALIQRKERARDLFDTAWTLGLIRGTVMAGLLVILAPVVGSFFASPEAVAVVRVMALVPLIGGLINIGVVEFRKELTFGPYYLLHTSGVVADLCVSLPLALWLGNAWALVGGWLALTAVRVALSYWLHPYRPALHLDGKAAGELLGYGRWIFGSTAIGWLITNGIYAMVGRLLGIQALGLYQMAWRVASLPTTEVTGVISGVTVAAYAKLQDSTVRVRVAYLRVLTAVALAATPIAVGIGLYGEDLVRVLLGARWGGIIPIVQVLALFGLVRSIGTTAGPLFQGLGRPRSQTFVGFVELGLLAGLLGPLTLWKGPVGTAIAATVGAVCGAAASLWVVSRLLGIRAGELVPILGWPLLACLPIAAIRIGFLGSLDTLIGLAGAIFMSGILYLTVLALLNRLNLYSLSPVMPSGIRQFLS
ncbi:MAG: lipopolysaccharide biosynthesis protein [candidate division NC10 bacterium]|nr:lipopolysaccharide biosynthesis protein [candidate division NC10 bacterium]